MLRIKIILLAFLVFASLRTLAQDKINVQVEYRMTDSGNGKLFSNRTVRLDSVKLNAWIRHRMNELYESGYLTAFYNLSYEANRSKVLFTSGQKYQLADLNFDQIEEEFLNKTGFRSNKLQEKPFSYTDITGLINAILDQAENTGYPFAFIRMDSIQIQNNRIDLAIIYESGPQIVFDTISTGKFTSINKKFLMNYLGIYEGKPFQQKTIDQIRKKIDLLPYVELIKEPELTIKQGKAVIHLALKSRKVSNFDGVLGLVPDYNTKKKTILTGQVNIDLYNLFLSGKQLKLFWQRFEPYSQTLNMEYYHPNILTTPLNIHVYFDLLKQDTTYINRNLNLDISVLTKNSWQLGFKTEFSSSRLISTTGLEDNELPENLDYNMNYYGLEYSTAQFNNMYFPTRGWGILSSILVGQKKILFNSGIEDALYEDIPMSSIQYKVSLELEHFNRVFRHFILRSKIAGSIIEGNSLVRNDLFRLGGLHSIRGFNEKSLFATGFVYANLELRAPLSSDSYIMCFYDQGVVSDRLSGNCTPDWPFGTGLGISLGTDAGMFNFILGMGQSKNQSLGFGQSKIHFGYSGRF